MIVLIFYRSIVCVLLRENLPCDPSLDISALLFENQLVQCKSIIGKRQTVSQINNCSAWECMALLLAWVSRGNARQAKEPMFEAFPTHCSNDFIWSIIPFSLKKN